MEMPNWTVLLKEIASTKADGDNSGADIVRRKYLSKLHDLTKRNVIAYYSGFLSKPKVEGVEINDEDKNGFMLCVHKLDKNKGLDLFLHTPGGDGAATESLIFYLREVFGHDIRAVVPQIAMSAGTIIACACKSILMGKHSNIGPVDPQFGGIPAVGIRKNSKWPIIRLRPITDMLCFGILSCKTSRLHSFSNASGQSSVARS
jgi:ClpP class serine protease